MGHLHIILLEQKDYLNQFLPERFCGTVYLLMGHPVYSLL